MEKKTRFFIVLDELNPDFTLKCAKMNVQNSIKNMEQSSVEIPKEAVFMSYKIFYQEVPVLSNPAVLTQITGLMRLANILMRNLFQILKNYSDSLAF